MPSLHAATDRDRAASAEAFVVSFHQDLSAFFSGSDEAAGARLRAVCPASMRLVYPSGAVLDGEAFWESIADRFGASPGFEAGIENLEVLEAQQGFAVVRYEEVQKGAKSSAAQNRRSAFALIRFEGGRWFWEHIQETASPS